MQDFPNPQRTLRPLLGIKAALLDVREDGVNRELYKVL